MDKYHAFFKIFFALLDLNLLRDNCNSRISPHAPSANVYHTKCPFWLNTTTVEHGRNEFETFFQSSLT